LGEFRAHDDDRRSGLPHLFRPGCRRRVARHIAEMVVYMVEDKMVRRTLA
jgi:hypothetical protein